MVDFEQVDVDWDVCFEKVDTTKNYMLKVENKSTGSVCLTWSDWNKGIRETSVDFLVMSVL